MNITVLHIADCPNWTEALAHVAEAARDFVPAPVVSAKLISTFEDAAKWNFAGSPTILRDGHDLFPTDGFTHDLACRIYLTPAGLRGSPTPEQIRERLESHD